MRQLLAGTLLSWFFHLGDYKAKSFSSLRIILFLADQCNISSPLLPNPMDIAILYIGQSISWLWAQYLPTEGVHLLHPGPPSAPSSHVKIGDCVSLISDFEWWKSPDRHIPSYHMKKEVVKAHLFAWIMQSHNGNHPKQLMKGTQHRLSLHRLDG